MSLNGSLDSLVEELNRLLVQAEAEVYTREQALSHAKGDLQRLRAMLRVAGVNDDAPKAQPKQKVERHRVVNADTREKVLAAIARHEASGQRAIATVPGSFVTTDITGDFHESSARTAIYALREEGLIRAVGKKPVGRARSPVAYARIVQPAVEESQHVG